MPCVELTLRRLELQEIREAQAERYNAPGFETLIDAIHSERECMDMLNGVHPVIQGPMVGYDAEDIQQARDGYAMWLAYEQSPAGREAAAISGYYDDQIPF